MSSGDISSFLSGFLIAVVISVLVLICVSTSVDIGKNEIEMRIKNHCEKYSSFEIEDELFSCAKKQLEVVK